MNKASNNPPTLVGSILVYANKIKELQEQLRIANHNLRVTTDALWKACGDDEDTVNSTIKSQGQLL